MVDSIKKVSDRSPVINVTFNRKQYVPIGSVSPEVIVEMGRRQTRLLNHARQQSQANQRANHTPNTSNSQP